MGPEGVRVQEGCGRMERKQNERIKNEEKIREGMHEREEPRVSVGAEAWEEMRSSAQGNMARGIAASSACQTDSRTDRRPDGCLLGYDRQFDKLPSTCDYQTYNKLPFHVIPQQHALFFFMIILFLRPSGSLNDLHSGTES